VSQSILKSTDLAIQVRGMTAFVELEQTYQNPSIAIVNGRYQFPLPSDSAVFFMQMRLDNRLITGVVKEKNTAQRIYQRAQQQGHKAALVKQQTGNVFQTEVANIEPGQEIAIKIKFQFDLDYVADSFVLRLPTVINSRYANHSPATKTAEVETDQAKTAEVKIEQAKTDQVKGGPVTDFFAQQYYQPPADKTRNYYQY
jgi:Ca-activated chloride channel family protein